MIPNSTTGYGKKLALSRSKSGHQITFRDDLPSVPTVAEHRPLDMSHSLSIALEVGHNNRRRRNSISLLFSRQRASSEQYTSTSFANVQIPSSGQKQQSKYRMIRLPFSSSSNKDNNTENPVLQLEDSFADIRLQLVSTDYRLHLVYSHHQCVHTAALNFTCLVSAGKHVAGDTGVHQSCADSVASGKRSVQPADSCGAETERRGAGDRRDDSSSVQSTSCCEPQQHHLPQEQTTTRTDSINTLFSEYITTASH